MASTSRKSNGSNGRGHGALALDRHATIAQPRRPDDGVGAGHRAQCGRSRRRRRHAGARPRQACDGDEEIATSADRQPPARPNRSRRRATSLVSSINELAASIEQVSANTASLASSVARDGGVGAGIDRLDSVGHRHRTGDGDGRSTGGGVGGADGQGDQSGRQRHRGAQFIRQRNGGRHRRDLAIDRRRRGQRDRPRSGGRGDLVVDQRDGRLYRGGRRHDRQPGHGRRTEFDVHRRDVALGSIGRRQRAGRSATPRPAQRRARLSSIDRSSRLRASRDRRTRSPGAWRAMPKKAAPRCSDPFKAWHGCATRWCSRQP